MAQETTTIEMRGHPTCATCSHYVPRAQVNDWDIPRTFGKCALVEMTCNMTVLVTDPNDTDDNGHVWLDLKPEYSEHLAGVMDGSSYRAELFPAPEYYCPMHSALMPQLINTSASA